MLPIFHVQICIWVWNQCNTPQVNCTPLSFYWKSFTINLPSIKVYWIFDITEIFLEGTFFLLKFFDSTRLKKIVLLWIFFQCFKFLRSSLFLIQTAKCIQKLKFLIEGIFYYLTLFAMKLSFHIHPPQSDVHIFAYLPQSTPKMHEIP